MFSKIMRDPEPPIDPPKQDEYTPRCPVCGEECNIVYRSKSDEWYSDIMGCDCCLEKLDADETPECFPNVDVDDVDMDCSPVWDADGKEPPEPRCPVCREVCDFVYRSLAYGWNYREIVGCDECLNRLRELNTFHTPECFPEPACQWN